MKYKIGDEVVLRPETKPYTFLNCVGNDVEIETFLQTFLIEKQVYSILDVSIDGDFSIGKEDIHICYIGHKHLKHAKEDTSFEDYHEKLSQNYSDSFTSLESDMKAELDKLEYENIVELRLAIFNSNTSRTLEEMQAIEAWLLGKYK